MKNVTKLFMAAALAVVVALPACNDDTTDPTPGGGTTKKTCKLLKTTDADGSSVSMTYDGDKLVKVVEVDGDDTYTCDITWDGDKVMRIDEDDAGDTYTYNVTYTVNNPSKVENVYMGEVDMYYNITWNADNRLAKVEGFYPGDPSDMLAERYTYSYVDGKLTEVTSEVDGNDNGALGDMEDYSTTAKILMRDDKINPLYGLPLYLTDFEDVLSLTKNNVLTATYQFLGNDIPVTASYEYNENDYPTKATTSALGETVITTMEYACE